MMRSASLSQPSVGDQPTEKVSVSPASRKRRWFRLPMALLLIYGLWLGWLAYVAWVNVRAGNQ